MTMMAAIMMNITTAMSDNTTTLSSTVAGDTASVYEDSWIWRDALFFGVCVLVMITCGGGIFSLSYHISKYRNSNPRSCSNKRSSSNGNGNKLSCSSSSRSNNNNGNKLNSSKSSIRQVLSHMPKEVLSTLLKYPQKAKQQQQQQQQQVYKQMQQQTQDLARTLMSDPDLERSPVYRPVTEPLTSIV